MRWKATPDKAIQNLYLQLQVQPSTLESNSTAVNRDVKMKLDKAKFPTNFSCRVVITQNCQVLVVRPIEGKMEERRKMRWKATPDKVIRNLYLQLQVQPSTLESTVCFSIVELKI